MFSAHRSSNGAFVVSASLAAFLASAALAGPIWCGDLDEGDAGATPTTAQIVTTNGTVARIDGKLSATGFMGQPDLVDLYLIRVAQPAILKLSTAGGEFGGGANFDTRLFLFEARDAGTQEATALSVFGNDNFSSQNPGSFIGNAANDGSGFVLQSPGFYFIAITIGGIRPLGPNGFPIFEGLEVPGRVAFGGFESFGTWGGQPTMVGGDYAIRVEGVVGVPAPGAFALLGLSALVGRRRR